MVQSFSKATANVMRCAGPRWIRAKNNAESLTVMNRARNWKEFNAALESFTAPTQNIVYADVDGHIGYHAAGVVPIRKSGDGSVPYDGSTDAGEWTSYIPIAKLPTLYDPPSGIIVTANQRIVGTDYPYFLTHHWAQPYRARRIFDLLNEKPKLSSDDFRRIHGDVYSIAGVSFTREAVKLLRPKLTPADEKLKAHLDAFEKWDGRVNAESTVAPIDGADATRFSLKNSDRGAGPGAGEKLSVEQLRYDSRSCHQGTTGCLAAERIFKLCRSAAGLLRRGDQHTHEESWRRRNEVDVGRNGESTFSTSTGWSAVDWSAVHDSTVSTKRNWRFYRRDGQCRIGVSMRLIADPSDWDKTQQGIALGESGLPKNPHWSDQLADWRAVTPREFPFTQPAC